MPELPELEILRRDLEKEVVGRRIKEAEVRPGSKAMKLIPRHGRRKEFQDLLVGAKVDAVERIGRTLVLTLDNGQVMTITLGSTGKLLKTSATEDIAHHTHVILGFTIGGQLRLVDPGPTSEMFVGPSTEAMGAEGLRDFAIDPLDEEPLTWLDFSALLESRKAAMKELLSDEKFICGLGDIYSDEVLFAAGLKHDRTSDHLSSQDVRRLYRGLIETLQEAVKARGTSLNGDGFVDLQGVRGGFQADLKVYGRQGKPCPRCRSEVARGKFAGRFTYFCPQCQS